MILLLGNWKTTCSTFDDCRTWNVICGRCYFSVYSVLFSCHCYIPSTERLHFFPIFDFTCFIKFLVLENFYWGEFDSLNLTGFKAACCQDFRLHGVLFWNFVVTLEVKVEFVDQTHKHAPIKLLYLFTIGIDRSRVSCVW